MITMLKTSEHVTNPAPTATRAADPSNPGHRRDRTTDAPAWRLLYSVEEAADLLGIGRTFMFHLVATGEIDSFKIGKHRKIPHGALDDYIQRLRLEQSAAAHDSDYEQFR
jgi:excisionase family DNA binding protein